MQMTTLRRSLSSIANSTCCSFFSRSIRFCSSAYFFLRWFWSFYRAGDVMSTMPLLQSLTFNCPSSTLTFIDFSCSIVSRFDRRLINDGCVRICLAGSNFSTEIQTRSVLVPRMKHTEQTLLLWIDEEDMWRRRTVVGIDQMRRRLQPIDLLFLHLVFIFDVFQVLRLHQLQLIFAVFLVLLLQTMNTTLNHTWSVRWSAVGNSMTWRRINYASFH